MVKNKIAFTDDVKVEDKAEFQAEVLQIARQRPNKKFIGLFRLKLWFHNRASVRRETKFRWWMRNKIGEPPTIFDSLTTARSARLMKNFIENKGHFYSEVGFTQTTRRKRTRVTYQVNLSEPYKINQVQYPDTAYRIVKLTLGYSWNSLLKPDDNFDVDVLNHERQRISDAMRDHGYYYFNKELVFYELDSSDRNKTIDIFLRIKDLQDTSKHKIFSIQNVFVLTDYSLGKNYDEQNTDTIDYEGLKFVSTEGRFRPPVIANAIHIEKGKPFNRRNNEKTITNLADLGAFKFINIKFNEYTSNGRNLLDCIIYLTPSKRQEMNIEWEANNSSDANLGTAVSYTYLNKNLFKGADQFTFSLTGGLESNLRTDEPFFNTSEVKAETNLLFNRFIIPFKPKFVNKDTRPKTRLSLKYDYVNRVISHTIHSANLSFGYDWKVTRTTRHVFLPIVINVVRFDESKATPLFLEQLDNNPTLKKSFTDQMILGLNYTLLNTDQFNPNDRKYYLFQGSIDLSGNLVHGLKSWAVRKKDIEQPYELFKLPYSQFARADADFKYHPWAGKHSSVAGRLFAGLGFPYGNSEALPYIKQYFQGGANSMRAWRIRTLGPGSFNYRNELVNENGDSVTYIFDQTGNLKLEANLEFRFDIFQFLKGAFFVDAGNIWILRKDAERENAEFDFSRFHKEFAMGAGIGARFDFSYFVIRFDTGLKLRDPGLRNQCIEDGNGFCFNERNASWVVRKFKWEKDYRKDNITFNLAIGYPF